LNNIDITWLEPLVSGWQGRVASERVPHAVMLLGAVGLGKRCAAGWLARQFLGLPTETLPQYPEMRPEQADLHWISPPEDKHVIGVDAIRGLVAELSLTSYEGRGKVAVIDPADGMTENAANSLLKTLEEPPGRTLLILVADRAGRIPATIFSRCQRVSVATPALADGLEWLNRVSPGTDWLSGLQEAGNAPLAALAAADKVDQSNAMGQAFAALPQRDATPLDVAANWAKLEPRFVFGWLAGQVQACILRLHGTSGQGARCVVSDTVLRGIDRRNLFCYLDTINRLRDQPIGSYNMLLTLESLLIDWADSLSNYREQGNI
jgi:DNA polymerase-3 subunit delta'